MGCRLDGCAQEKDSPARSEKVERRRRADAKEEEKQSTETPRKELEA